MNEFPPHIRMGIVARHHARAFRGAPATPGHVIVMLKTYSAINPLQTRGGVAPGSPCCCTCHDQSSPIACTCMGAI